MTRPGFLSTTVGFAVDVPEPILNRIAGHEPEVVFAGRSGAMVVRLTGPDGTALYLKIAVGHGAGEIEAEARALRWLTERGVECAPVVATVTESDRVWLLSGAVPGSTLADAAATGIGETIIAIAATALRDLHAVPVADCPVDARFDSLLAIATARVSAGHVDEQDFDAERRGRGSADILAELATMRHGPEDLVVTHGDATFENLMTCGGRFSGFIDCGKLGVADRHRDLALVTRDIENIYGIDSIKLFETIYGRAIDPIRLEMYRILDEFF